MPTLHLNFAARLSKKAKVHAIFILGSEEQSIQNIEDLIDAAEYFLSVLRKGNQPMTCLTDELCLQSFTSIFRFSI